MERAPVDHVNELSCPVLLLQGLDDPVVPAVPVRGDRRRPGRPRHQARVPRLRGESHGFRKAESVIASLEAELAFYGEIFGFTPPGVPPVELA